MSRSLLLLGLLLGVGCHAHSPGTSTASAPSATDAPTMASTAGGGPTAAPTVATPGPSSAPTAATPTAGGGPTATPAAPGDELACGSDADCVVSQATVCEECCNCPRVMTRQQEKHVRDMAAAARCKAAECKTVRCEPCGIVPGAVCTNGRCTVAKAR